MAHTGSKSPVFGEIPLVLCIQIVDFASLWKNEWRGIGKVRNRGQRNGHTARRLVEIPEFRRLIHIQVIVADTETPIVSNEAGVNSIS